MMRACVGLLTAGLLVSACGDDGSPSSEPVEGEPAEDALERQVRFLTDGQTGRAYAEIHPAQQELFTADEYAACVGESVGGLQVERFDVKETFIEEITIPATDLTVEATAITAELVTNLGIDTDTFHEVDVDGEWRFTVSLAQDIIDGTC